MKDRDEAAFVYHLGLFYRSVGEYLGHSHQAVHEWYPALADLLHPKPDNHELVTVAETKVKEEDEELFVWAAVDVSSFGRSTSGSYRVVLTLTRCYSSE